MPLHSQEPLSIEDLDGSKPGQRILRFQGPVVLGTVFQFQAAIRAKDAATLIMDFTGVPYIDSAGIGALVGAYVSQNKAGRKLALVGVSERLFTALQVTRVEQFFRIYKSLPEAQEA